MATLLYGLTLAGEPAPAAAAGIGGAPVRELPCGPLRALVSTIAAKPPASIDAVREHDAVLRQFVDAGATVAAVRFGQSFADDAACIAEVAERSPRLETLLRTHRGCIEMRVLLPAETESTGQTAAGSAGPGRAYLEALRARGQVAPQLALAPMLGPAVRAERVEGFASRKGAVRGVAFAHLVHRDDVSAYREAIRAVPSLAEARVVGPLPLYSFAEPAS